MSRLHSSRPTVGLLQYGAISPAAARARQHPGIGQPGRSRHRLEHHERRAIPARLEPVAGALEIVAGSLEVAASRLEHATREPRGLRLAALQHLGPRPLRQARLGEPLVRHRQRLPQPRAAATVLDRLLEARARVAERAPRQRGERRAGRVIVLLRRLGRGEVGDEARANRQQARERSGIAAPRVQHGGEVLDLAPQLLGAQRFGGERAAAALTARATGRGVAGQHDPGLARLAPCAAILRARADPGTGPAMVAAHVPARAHWMPPRLPLRVPRSR